MQRRCLPSVFQSLVTQIRYLGLGLLSGSAVALMSPMPASAVETVTINLGPVQPTLRIDDLELFSETGEIPPRLERYRHLLTPQVQTSLANHLNLDPAIRDRIIADLTDYKDAQPILDSLVEVAPSLSLEAIQLALQTAAEDESGVTITSLLRALPGDNLELEGGALFNLLSNWGLTTLEQTALSNVLDYELIASSRAKNFLAQKFDPSTPGNHGVERWSVSFRDPERDRTIPIDLYWNPHARGPLVLLSHGLGADRHFFAYLARHLASHGLTVAALEHPGSNVDALVKQEGSLLPTEEFVERPRDVSFILDRLEDLNNRSLFMQGRLNLAQVTLIGHSLGGYTGLVLAGGRLNPVALENACADLAVGASSPADWLQCAATETDFPVGDLQDDRITQLVVMNPLTGKIFGEAGLRRVRVPTLFLTGTNDGIASVSDQQLQAFNQLSGPRSLIAVIGGTHLSVGDPSNINPALTQVPFMPEHSQATTARLRRYLKGTVLSFVMQHTNEARKYREFLSADYAELFSTPELPIRYSDRLPTNVSRWLANSERLNQRVTPLFKRLASLVHLELIAAHYRITAIRQQGTAFIPLQPLALSARVPRSSVFYSAVNQRVNRGLPHPAK
ncbi:MAG: alpha/beta fold hydrolase [Cyanobacteria bacterium P01_H01_bin.58]